MINNYNIIDKSNYDAAKDEELNNHTTDPERKLSVFWDGSVGILLIEEENDLSHVLKFRKTRHNEISWYEVDICIYPSILEKQSENIGIPTYF